MTDINPLADEPQDAETGEEIPPTQSQRFRADAFRDRENAAARLRDTSWSQNKVEQVNGTS